jgi:hypothetical protein
MLQDRALFLRDDEPPRVLRDCGATIVGREAFKTLGAHFATDARVAGEAEVARMTKHIRKCRLLLHQALPVQDAMILLRYCVGPSATHLMRASLFERSRTAVELVDEFAAEVLFRRALGMEIQNDAHRQQVLKQAQLPARTGFPGLGLPAPSKHHPGAFFAGLVQAAPLLSRPEVRRWAVRNEVLSASLTSAVRRSEVLRRPPPKVAKLLPDEAARDVHWFTIANVVDYYSVPGRAEAARHKLQKLIGQELHTRARDSLLEELPPVNRALCDAVSQSGCARWLNAVPDCEDTVLTDAQYTQQARTMLGLLPGLAPELKEQEDVKCQCLSTNTLRDAPFHPLNCKSGMRTVILRRHNAVIDVIGRFHRKAGYLSTPHANAYDHFSKRNPDMTVYKPGGVALLDITVRNPLAACRPQLARPLANCSSTWLCLRNAEKEKLVKYADMVRPGVSIIPVAYSVFGAVGQLARSVASFKHVAAECLPDDSFVNRRRLEDRLRTAICCTIVKFNLEVHQCVLQGQAYWAARAAMREHRGGPEGVDPEEAAEHAADHEEVVVGGAAGVGAVEVAAEAAEAEAGRVAEEEDVADLDTAASALRALRL